MGGVVSNMVSSYSAQLVRGLLYVEDGAHALLLYALVLDHSAPASAFLSCIVTYAHTVSRLARPHPRPGAKPLVFWHLGRSGCRSVDSTRRCTSLASVPP